ncbi:nuclear egress membrane protein [Canid alphaherpesvirus 1]|nr:nuclear egress membrane protein [Canid alphaherpesvirus 1]WHU31595.1 nuclear egress membrane protein [Canid alphaherpesvirus 1]WHU31669.1 nuclear egress membrane protein [Canid alphaherpesvirus 1]
MVYNNLKHEGGYNLLQRIKLVVSSNIQHGDIDISLSNPKHLPTRCIFQFNGQDRSDVVFPIEYILRLMSNWAETICDPYIKIQNTGVSVLFQGFFFKPYSSPIADISTENNNVILQSTESTGVTLSSLEHVKREGGMDTRPLRAMMQVNCFVRMPKVQLSFRFMGPEDLSRTQHLFDRISNLSVIRKHQTNIHQKRSLLNSSKKEEYKDSISSRRSQLLTASNIFSKLINTDIPQKPTYNLRFLVCFTFVFFLFSIAVFLIYYK